MGILVVVALLFVVNPELRGSFRESVETGANPAGPRIRKDVDVRKRRARRLLPASMEDT
jgi:hypothetical protein